MGVFRLDPKDAPANCMAGRQRVHHLVVHVDGPDPRPEALGINEYPCLVGGVSPDFTVAEP